MSDRIAVMNNGVVEQIGSPREIYERPDTAFVADFIGSLNALDLTVDAVESGLAVHRLAGDDRLVVPVGSSQRIGEQLKVAVRPERVRIVPGHFHPHPVGGSHLLGTIAEVVYLGMLTQ